VIDIKDGKKFDGEGKNRIKMALMIKDKLETKRVFFQE